jgi:hypothetical protein
VAQKASRPQDLPTDFGDRVLLFPIREASCVPVEVPTLTTNMSNLLGCRGGESPAVRDKAVVAALSQRETVKP